jgi:hypothetical protein
LVSKLAIACLAAAAWSLAQTAISLPAWLAAYPGANARTQTTPGLVESAYVTSAKPEEVVAHYRKLFETAGLFFQPGFDGMGTVVRGAAPEGDLLILIRQQGKGTSVRVDLTAKSPGFAATPAPAPVTARTSFEERVAQQQEDTRKVLEQADEGHRKRIQDMEKYDAPMRPERRPPPPALVWPAWLVHIDGARLQIEKGVDHVGLKILQCSFLTYTERNDIQQFYADLLNSHGFPVRMQSGPTWPGNRKAWVDASNVKLGEGPGIDVHIDVTPAAAAQRVDLRLTARP